MAQDCYGVGGWVGGWVGSGWTDGRTDLEALLLEVKGRGVLPDLRGGLGEALDEGGGKGLGGGAWARGQEAGGRG